MIVIGTRAPTVGNLLTATKDVPNPLMNSEDTIEDQMNMNVHITATKTAAFPGIGTGRKTIVTVTTSRHTGTMIITRGKTRTTGTGEIATEKRTTPGTSTTGRVTHTIGMKEMTVDITTVPAKMRVIKAGTTEGVSLRKISGKSAGATKRAAAIPAGLTPICQPTIINCNQRC